MLYPLDCSSSCCLFSSSPDSSVFIVEYRPGAVIVTSLLIGSAVVVVVVVVVSRNRARLGCDGQDSLRRKVGAAPSVMLLSGMPGSVMDGAGNLRLASYTSLIRPSVPSMSVCLFSARRSFHLRSFETIYITESRYNKSISGCGVTW